MLQHEWTLKSEINQSQDTNVVWFHLNEGHRIVKFVKRESRMMIARGWREEENEELVFNGHKVSIWEDEQSSRGAE